MDPSVQFLLGSDVPASEGATIHSIAPPSTASIDDDKIGFTLDVAVRLDQESEEPEQPGVVIPLAESPPQELADSA
ncbi:MAG TPA: hypothetical protein VNT80_02665 [Acidimicrobiales bacterium]|nr:hypothetical protein [Acidimicrobiales bacterium]